MLNKCFIFAIPKGEINMKKTYEEAKLNIIPLIDDDVLTKSTDLLEIDIEEEDL